MSEERPERGYLASAFGCYCPRCRRGKLFRRPLNFRLNGFMKMNEHCAVCGQPTEIEVGFYYGTGFVSYFLAVIISVISLLLWYLVFGFSFSDNRFFYWLAFNAFLLVVMQPWLMRFSRSLWISWFVKYDPDWAEHPPEEPERVNPDQQHNW
jgi:uncharacterized protein (DUF983 family)